MGMGLGDGGLGIGDWGLGNLSMFLFLKIYKFINVKNIRKKIRTICFNA